MLSVVKLNTNSHLIIVATPIGNLNEINKRALDAFIDNKYFLCEDTRNTIHLFNLLNIEINNKIFISYHKYNEKIRSNEILKILKSNNLVLVSDAGYPGISDPGYIIINECIKNNIFIELINGSSAFMNALVISGWSNLPTTFYGFIDWKKDDVYKFSGENKVLCFFESVHRINETLEIMNKVFGNVEVCVVRELTKLNETHYYGNLNELRIDNNDKKGEFVILLNNSNPLKNDINKISNDFLSFSKEFETGNLKQKIKLYLTILNKKDVKANEIYNLIISQKKNDKL